MFKLNYLSFALILLFGMTLNSQAALLIEPVVGYNVSGKAEVEDGGNYSGGVGTAYGGRLGYQKLGFQLGLDYLNSKLDLDDDDFKSKLNTSEWAAFVGFEFPILLRVYAGYIFSATGDSQKFDDGTGGGYKKLKLEQGSGMKLGVGFTLLPFLNINVEYRRSSFTDNTIGGSDLNKDVDYSTYMVGISIPFTI